MIRTLATAAMVGFFLTLFAAPASAGVATAGAVLLDPYDPVPEIQFRHYGGYGCSYGCGYSDCEHSCYRHASYDRCGDGCHRRHWRCDDCAPRDNCGDRCDRGCDRDCDNRCDHDCNSSCDHDCGRDDRTAMDTTCQSERCYNDEHYERHWRDGDKVGQEWMDRGMRERTLPDGRGTGGYYRPEPSWRDDDDASPPPPPPPQDDHHHH